MAREGRGLALGALLLLVWSCGSDEEPPSSAGIGPEGGTLALPDGARIELPPGAVPAGVKVVASVVEDAVSPPTGTRLSGKVYAFTPHGTRFEKPVTIRIPAANVANSVLTLDDDEDTSWEEVASVREKGFHAVTVEHISLFAEVEVLEGVGGAGGASAAGGRGGEGGDDEPSFAGSGGADGLGGSAGGGEAGADAGPLVVRGRMCVGSHHGCAIVEGGKIACWGMGDNGQLGDGMFYSPPTIYGRSTAALIPGIDNAVQLSCGQASVSALLADHTLISWGRGDLGQLGDGTDTEKTAVPRLSSISGVKQISSSGWHACALLEDQTVSCWGRSDVGELGDGEPHGGTLEHVNTPQPVPGLSGVLEVATGPSHTCAVLADSTVKCWGANWYGQLGVLTPWVTSSPVAVPGLTGVTHLALGEHSSCALLQSGEVSCWGRAGWGQLGDGVARADSDAVSATPVSVLGSSGSQWLASGSGHACLIDAADRLRCWGGGELGQLGDGPLWHGTLYEDFPYGVLSPQPVWMLEGAEEVALGPQTSCARLHDQSLWCWGYGVYGALGSGFDYPNTDHLGPLEEFVSAVPVRVVGDGVP